MLDEKKCFLDRERPCERSCKAFDEKTSDCKLVRSISGMASTFSVWTRWLQHHDPPRAN